MDGYIFHCTPCGKAHAGDCPPKAPAGVKEMWEAAVKDQNNSHTMYAGGYPYVRSSKIFIPSVGTKWTIEDYDFVANVWRPRTCVAALYYQVKTVVSPLVVVDTYSPPLPVWEQDVEQDAFLDTGHDTGSARFRMVFKP